MQFVLLAEFPANCSRHVEAGHRGATHSVLAELAFFGSLCHSIDHTIHCVEAGRGLLFTRILPRVVARERNIWFRENLKSSGASRKAFPCASLDVLPVLQMWAFQDLLGRKNTLNGRVTQFRPGHFYC
jgi:hypothetical protein